MDQLILQVVELPTRPMSREVPMVILRSLIGALLHPDVAYPGCPGGLAAFACSRNFCSLPVTDPRAVAVQRDRLQRATRQRRPPAGLSTPSAYASSPVLPERRSR